MVSVATLNETRRVSGRGEPLPKRDQPDDEEDRSRARLEEQMKALVAELERIAKEQIGAKSPIEERWLTDLRQFYGRYTSDVEADLKERKKSRLFIKLTRMKTSGWESRLSDMLFPTDENNWGIQPTPVPSLVNKPDMDPESEEAQAAEEQENKAAEVAGEAAKGMESEIEDQFREARYGVKARDCIHDMCKLGTGIMKGPMVAMKSRRRWTVQNITDDEGKVVGTNRVMVEEPDPKPDWLRINPWMFFPDMSATSLEEAEFTFELHLDNKKQLRKRAKTLGFEPEATRRILQSTPNDGPPASSALLRDITGAGTHAQNDKYWVWEYHGPIEHDAMLSLLQLHGDEDGLEEIELDPLDEYNVILWFCQGEVLKFGPHPLDSGDHLYSVANFERDDMSIFGHGVPFLMRDSQDALNGAWRMMMDNGALSAGPQVVIDQAMIEPADGDWTLTPRKVWLAKETQVKGAAAPFAVHNIPNNQGELANIINLSKGFADDETNFPLVAQGESGRHQTTTVQGLAMLMNSVNVVFRRVVRNFDDDMTTPNVTRAYDWNMQFNPDESIKGDYNVDARGSSVLLIKDLQAQNLMALASNFAGSEIFGPMTKLHAMYVKLVQSMNVPSDEVVKTEKEWKADMDKLAQNKGPSPEEQELQIKIGIAEMENETARIIAGFKREEALAKLQANMITLAEQRNMSLDELRKDLEIAQLNVQSKERLFAAEAGLKQRFGEGI